ncbi:Crp/Fnr family transcriptional regulator [Pseudosulfitobacter koreensis]|uniref:Crp/Fnr family transcriptional regulator n=1 Tax=Pseudosulfitobacter koreensis TaxID=2968472 RepID=A0ABT1YZP4_9RHOB|nr:Crp/Fnr family transcriptional regulator [Pseudosulfitobacter koreense]MCR8826358.1 Crp/Fnr family transcriptional regulator [Pseudosulfitobacter koreense]
MPKRLICPFGQNNLLHTLSAADRTLIEPHLQHVDMDRRMVMEGPNKPVEHIYFLKSGVGSTVASSESGRRIEVGLFGCEGMSGTSVVLQTAHSSFEVFMQISGEGFAIEADKMRGLLEQSPSMQRHLLRYVQTLMTQTSQTALSNGQCKLEERLARWLLMCHDRINGDVMELTHEFLSVMLGVRRAGVTVAIHMLEGKGLIRARRGEIVILDREGLENDAQNSYGVPETEYARVIGFDRPDA